MLDGGIQVEHAHTYMRTDTSTGKCVIGDKNTLHCTAIENILNLYLHMNVYVFCLWAKRKERKLWQANSKKKKKKKQ